MISPAEGPGSTVFQPMCGSGLGVARRGIDRGAESAHASAEDAEATHLLRLLTPLEQDLEPEADPEIGDAGADTLDEDLAERAVHRVRDAAERPLAGDDEDVRRTEREGVVGEPGFGRDPRVRRRVPDRAEHALHVPDAAVDHRDPHHAMAIARLPRSMLFGDCFFP